VWVSDFDHDSDVLCGPLWMSEPDDGLMNLLGAWTHVRAEAQEGCEGISYERKIQR